MAAERKCHVTTRFPREACGAAYPHEFNQTISRDALADVPPDGVYPVLIAQPHSGATRASGGLSDAPTTPRTSAAWSSCPAGYSPPGYAPGHLYPSALRGNRLTRPTQPASTAGAGLLHAWAPTS